MKTLILALAAMVSLMIAGCTGESWMTETGAASADAGPSADAGYDHGQPKQDAAACVPQCSGKNCGSNGCGGVCGTCDSNETCNSNSLCTPKSAAHACTKGACDSGERCWCDGGGKYTCYTLTGLCVTSPTGIESCDSTSSNTAWCTIGTCIGADMSLKSAMCSTPAASCVTTGCPSGQACNSGTGKCEANGGTGGPGDINCTVKRTDSSTWTNLFGGGVVDAGKIGLDSWSQLGKPDNNGTVSFTLKAGLTTLSVLPEIVVDTFYGYGADKGADTVEGGWAIKCDGAPQYVFPAGVNTVASCSGNLAIGQGCLWKGGPGKYRMGYRAR